MKGSCLMDMLMTVQALQYPLLDLLLDVMLMCCQHLIMLEGQSWDLNDTEEDDQLEAESVSDSGHEADAERNGVKVKGKGHAGNIPESRHMQQKFTSAVTCTTAWWSNAQLLGGFINVAVSLGSPRQCVVVSLTRADCSVMFAMLQQNTHIFLECNVPACDACYW